MIFVVPFLFGLHMENFFWAMQLAQMQASMMQALVQPQWPQAYDGEPLLQPLGQHAPPSASAPVPTVVAQAAQGCEPAPDGTGNIQEQCPGGLRPAEYRSRSRTPPPQVAPSTPEVPSPEALALDSPEMPDQPLEPPTPEVLRRLLTIAKEGDMNMSKTEATERLSTLATQAQARVAEQLAQVSTVGTCLSTGQRPMGKAHFQPAEVQQAREAIAALTEDITKVCKARPASAQATLQLNVKFAEPVPSAGDLAARIQGLLGAKGPAINVEPLEGPIWRKPSTSTWFAERKGDARNCVYRVNIPPDSSHKKPRNLSFQVAVGGRELTVKGVKGALQQLGPNIVLMFGPHRCVDAAKTQAATTSLDDFWGTR